MKRLHMRNKAYTHMIEWADTGSGLVQAKAFRRNHPEFKGCRIKRVFQLNPSNVPCGDIIELT